MRNLVLILAFANILYFMWSRWVAQPVVDPDIVRRDASELIPVAELAPPVTGNAEERAGQLPQCFSIGSFDDPAEADNRLNSLQAAGLTGGVRKADGVRLTGHWVYVGGLADKQAANRQLAQLKAGGVTDAYVIGGADEGYVISLGIFSERPRAYRIEQQAKALGAQPVVEDRTEPGEVYWLDIETSDTLLLERYLLNNPVEQTHSGEDAICPQ